jgi:hypothetical protein
MSDAAVTSLGDGLLRWAARHPEWHPGNFGAEVASYALDAGPDLLVVDPLLPADDADVVLSALESLIHDRVAILITIGYHVRSSEELWERWRSRVPVRLLGPPHAARRFNGAAAAAFEELAPGAEGPAAVRAFSIGRPVRGERPLWFPSHDAIAFGDAVVVTPDGELKIWSHEQLDDRRKAFYRDRFAPTLTPLLELPARRILVTHGSAVVDDAAGALRRAVESTPWYHHG